MKRFMTRFASVIIFILGIILALGIFFPWGEAGKFALNLGYSQLGRMGMSLSYSDVVGEDDGFTVNNVRISGMTDISLSSLTIRPRFWASILSLGIVCDVEFKGCNIRLGQNMNVGDGGFLLTVKAPQILLEELRTNGEFSLNGYITLDSSTMKISHAEARLTVPESFSQNMSVLRNFLPLVQEGGRWYLRR
ncbi:MAG: hypothetical protein IJQ74_00960 [Synergistaceae bacterium]|nr:hypothetical protein [Synergistaceae bacterium]